MAVDILLNGSVYRGINYLRVPTSDGGTAVFNISGSSDVPCTGISLDQTTATITHFGTATLQATVTPSDCTQLVEWSSSNEDIATVDATGLVSGVSTGTCEISATCGEYSASCTLTVTGLKSGVNTGARGDTVTVSGGNHVSINHLQGANMIPIDIWDMSRNDNTITNTDDAVASLKSMSVIMSLHTGDVVTIKAENVSVSRMRFNLNLVGADGGITSGIDSYNNRLSATLTVENDVDVRSILCNCATNTGVTGEFDFIMEVNGTRIV